MKKWLIDFLPQTWKAWVMVIGTLAIMFTLAYLTCTEWACW